MDLLVNLYDVDYKYDLDADIKVVRVLSPNIHLVNDFIKTNFGDNWTSEASVALYKTNPTCFVAVKEKEIIGFSCYDATAKGYFGPIGVSEKYRIKGVGKALLLEALHGLKNDGYGYAIIGGGSGKYEFYKKVCNAIPINNKVDIYTRMIKK